MWITAKLNCTQIYRIELQFVLPNATHQVVYFARLREISKSSRRKQKRKQQVKFVFLEYTGIVWLKNGRSIQILEKKSNIWIATSYFSLDKYKHFSNLSMWSHLCGKCGTKILLGSSIQCYKTDNVNSGTNFSNKRN